MGVVGRHLTSTLLATTPHVVSTFGNHNRVTAQLGATLPPSQQHRLRAGPDQFTPESATGTHPDVVVVATPNRSHLRIAQYWTAQGSDVITLTDDLDVTKRLLGLGSPSQTGTRLVVGAGMMPGLTCALAGLAARTLDSVTELHLAKHGTGGPACARQHHRALRTTARNLRDGDMERRAGGSGRELVWFPEPIEGADCYFAELPDPLLLERAHLGLERATARIAANRRDRFTSFLPALLPPHAEGGIGAVRLEARGTDREGRFTTLVFGATGKPGVVGAATAHAVAQFLLNSPKDLVTPGAMGVGELRADSAILPHLRDAGVTLETFEGTDSSDH